MESPAYTVYNIPRRSADERYPSLRSRSTTWKLAATRICMLDVKRREPRRMGCIQAHPPGSFEISKWINFIDRIATFNTGDETTLTLSRRFNEFLVHGKMHRDNEISTKNV